MTDISCVGTLTQLATVLQEMHTDKGMSWRQIALETKLEGVSHVTLRDIAMGKRISPQTRRKLGLPPLRIRISAEVTEEQRAYLHNLAKTVFGCTWTEMIRMLADGEIRIGG